MKVGVEVATGTLVKVGLGGIGVGVGGTGVEVGGAGVLEGTGLAVGVSVAGTGVSLGNGVLVGNGVSVGRAGSRVGTVVLVGGNGVGVKVGCGAWVGSAGGTWASRAPQPQLRDKAISAIIGNPRRPAAKKLGIISLTRQFLGKSQSPYFQEDKRRQVSRNE